jgi:hypothetical protein
LRSRRSTSRAAKFTAICAILLLVDAGIGWYSLGRCIDAGDACTNANAWVDGVTAVVAVALSALILIGTTVSLVQRARWSKRGKTAP